MNRQTLLDKGWRVDANGWWFPPNHFCLGLTYAQAIEQQERLEQYATRRTKDAQANY